jgi:hypothetical protein
MTRDVTSLEQVLDRIDRAADDQEQVSVGMIVEAVGSRSFGPLLLLAGVVMVSPLSGIPGMPTTKDVLVLLVAWQLLFGRRCCWLPQWLLTRSIARDKVAGRSNGCGGRHTPSTAGCDRAWACSSGA